MKTKDSIDSSVYRDQTQTQTPVPVPAPNPNPNPNRSQIQIQNRGRCVQIINEGEDLKKFDLKTEVSIANGRLDKPLTVTLKNMHGVFSHELPGSQINFKLGDLIEVCDEKVRVLTATEIEPCEHGEHEFSQKILDPRRLKALKIRAQVELGIREFFAERSFIEVRTPLLVQSPGMEPHIKPFQLTNGAFVPTSPEFAMKKIMVGGLERIFQLGPAFRDEPVTSFHHPEFTMLEWYRAYEDYFAVMKDFEDLIESLAKRINKSAKISYQGSIVDVAAPWPRKTVAELFKEFANIDLKSSVTLETLKREAARIGVISDLNDDWDDIFFKIWIERIEPYLPKNRGLIVYQYPPSQAALSKLDTLEDGTTWAKRFEPYIGGIELGNAFEELTDADEQFLRFEKDMDLRRKIHPDFPISPIDPEFIQALKEGLPPSAGIAVGVDRLVMLFADEPDIANTMWLPSYSATAK